MLLRQKIFQGISSWSGERKNSPFHLLNKSEINNNFVLTYKYYEMEDL